MYHIEFTREKTVTWVRQNIYLLLALLWVALIPVALRSWERPITFMILIGLYLIVTGSLVTTKVFHDTRSIKRVLSYLESREVKVESNVEWLLTTITEYQEEIMAIGNETRTALTELREAIATETDQAVEKIIAATNADSATADAIREAIADVKNIIPDNVEETDVPAVQEPVDEEPVDEEPELPVEDEDEVDPEGLPADDL